MEQPLDANFILEKDLVRAVEELDVPTRMTATSVKEVFRAYKADEISFTMIAYSMMI